MQKKIIILIVIVIFTGFIPLGITSFLFKNKSHVQDPIKIPVLLYHDVSAVIPDSDPYNFNYITKIDSFEENMATLLCNGYSVISINDLYHIEKRNEKLPEKPVIINFDDGLISNYELVFPVVKKYNIKVGMSITTDLVGTRDSAECREYFSWEQAKEMYESGLVEFYNHGNRHIHYNTIPVTEFRDEVLESRNMINANLDMECDVFVYPYSAHHHDMVSILESSGIKIQLYDLGINNSKNIRYSSIRRMNIPHGMTGKDILSYIEEH